MEERAQEGEEEGAVGGEENNEIEEDVVLWEGAAKTAPEVVRSPQATRGRGRSIPKEGAPSGNEIFHRPVNSDNNPTQPSS